MRLTNEFSKRKGAAKATQELKMLLEAGRRHGKTPIINGLVGDAMVHENEWCHLGALVLNDLFAWPLGPLR